MIHRELGVAIGEVLDLLLLGDNLLVEEVDLLGGHRVIVALGLLSRGWCFSADVIEGLFAVRPEFWVLEFPRLFSVRGVSFNFGMGSLHFARMATGRFPHCFGEPCGSRTCSVGVQNWRSCCA
jgi:hypothetical protein